MRVKEAPASALRAMFGGIGALLGVTDKVRAKPATPEATAPEAAAPEATAVTETAPVEAVATPTVEPEAEAPEAVVPEVELTEVVVAEIVGDEVIVTEVVVAEVVAPDAPAEATGALPLANYDDLSIASLRARLRNLSADQLVTLTEYEKSHAARADVITMFERRIAKLAEA